MAPLPTVREDEQEDDAETPRETTPLAPHPGQPAAKFPSPRWRGALAISAVGIASVLGLGAVTGQFSCGGRLRAGRAEHRLPRLFTY